ncbi:hypothetical protein BDV35DRAFT_394811 [Aspergillus flavus]|uniref:Uncharacterized protein n=2 Tax=Aspergillus subgen. Circumdati TaxID=2720871 RepID=A0A1S9DH87_ASPOZ|nr:hypothetical protein BDV35DRAFT_394811 [Aspergillus flavus]OOO08441.1 hypothetical protein OAory_01097370 [Aspergillus oryzae]
MTTSTERYRDSLENDCYVSIERPDDFSLRGSASNPIPIDIEGNSAKTPSPDDTDGDSYRSQSHICHNQVDDEYLKNGIVSVASDSHKVHSVTRHGAVHEGVAGESLFSGETAAKPSKQNDCIPGGAVHATVAESSVRNTGHTTEIGRPAALLSEHVSDGSNCIQNTMLPSVEQINNRTWVDADTKTDDNQRPNSITRNPPDNQTGSIKAILTHRSTLEGHLSFLCLGVEWYSDHELRQWAPELLNEYLYRIRLHERPRAHKRRAVSKTPLVSEERKRFRGV